MVTLTRKVEKVVQGLASHWERLQKNYRGKDKVTARRLAAKLGITDVEALRLIKAADDGEINKREYRELCKNSSNKLKAIARYHQHLGYRFALASPGSKAGKAVAWAKTLKGGELYGHLKDELNRAGPYTMFRFMKYISNEQLDTMKNWQRAELIKLVKQSRLYHQATGRLKTERLTIPLMRLAGMD